MSFLTTQIKLRKPVPRVIGALIGASVVKLTVIFVFPAVFLWIGWQPSGPGWLFIPIYLGITSFMPLYVTVWIYWRLTPACRTTAWSRKATILAATAGLVIEVALLTLLSSVPGLSVSAVYWMLATGSFAPVGIVAVWIFEGLKPTEEDGPISRWRKRKRTAAGQCATCGYDLTGNTSGVCPECGEAVIDPAEQVSKPVIRAWEVPSGQQLRQWVLLTSLGTQSHAIHERWIRRDKVPFWVCRLVSYPVFAISFYPAAYLVDWLCEGSAGSGATMDALTRKIGSEFAAWTLVAAWIAAFAYIPARVSYVLIAFRPNVDDLAHCRKCRYDLTGNTSGTRPECGTKIETDDESE